MATQEAANSKDVFEQLRRAVDSFQESHRDFTAIRKEQARQAAMLEDIRMYMAEARGRDLGGRIEKLEGHFEPETGLVDRLRMDGAKRVGRAEAWGKVATAIGVALGILKIIEELGGP